MIDNDKSYCLASDSEPELMDWMTKLQLALQHNNDKREEKPSENNSNTIFQSIISNCLILSSFYSLFNQSSTL